MTATTTMDNFMLLGGDASGPALRASMTIEKMSMAIVMKPHKRHELMDSEIG